MKRASLSFDVEIDRWKNHPRMIIGIDEVGRGCLAGPVVAAAVAFDWSDPDPIRDLARRHLIHDSKTLNRKRRTEAAAAIREVAIDFGIGEVDPSTIDEINILQATLKAMRASMISFPLSGALVLVDGNQRIPGIDIDQETVIDGDAKIFSIAAASIVAKEYRDQLMERCDDEFPGYNFSSHKGYGTKDHVTAIRSLGLTPIHRKTFWHG